MKQKIVFNGKMVCFVSELTLTVNLPEKDKNTGTANI